MNKYLEKAKKYLPAAGLVAGAAVGRKLGPPLVAKLGVKALTHGVTDVEALARGERRGLLLGEIFGANSGMVAGGIAGAASGIAIQKMTSHDKTAALGELLEYGIDYDQAVELVKEAAGPEYLKDEVKYVDSVLANEQKNKPNSLINIAKKSNPVGAALGVLTAIEVGKRAFHAIQKMTSHDKTAALSELLEAGVDYDQAVELVKEAAGGIVDKAKEYLPAAGLVTGALVGAKLGVPLGAKLGANFLAHGATGADFLAKAGLGLIGGTVVGTGVGVGTGAVAGAYTGKKLKEAMKNPILKHIAEKGNTN